LDASLNASANLGVKRGRFVWQVPPQSKQQRIEGLDLDDRGVDAANSRFLNEGGNNRKDWRSLDRRPK
jgi:hypothetical protein